MSVNPALKQWGLGCKKGKSRLLSSPEVGESEAVGGGARLEAFLSPCRNTPARLQQKSNICT